MVSLLFVSVPTGAAAEVIYRDTGLDPDDTSGVADISSTTRTVRTNANGRRSITMKIRAYEPLGPSWGGFDASIDYRGGPRRDARITFANNEGPPHCALNLPDGSGWIFSARQVGRTIGCTFRLRLLQPTKRIRWKVRSPTSGTFDLPDIDRAPNNGWYA